jgi:hypothetical protein
MYPKSHNVPEESQCSLYREELVVPYNQFNKNLVGGLVGCYSYNLCHMGSQGILFFPCKGTILECVY